MGPRLGRLVELGLRLGHEIAVVAAGTGPRTTARWLAALAASAPDIVSRKSLAPADRRMAHGPDVAVRVDGATLRVPAEWFGGVRELCCRRVYEAVPGFAPGPGDVVVDLGANVGLFTCMAAARGATVVAVEAQRGFEEVLAGLAARNGLAAHIHQVWGLVGAETGVLSQPDRRASASHMRDLEPPVLDLAEVLSGLRLERVDLLKIDIEGSEFALLAGEPRWLDRVRRVVMEVHSHYGSADALRALLERRGFTVTQLDDDLRPLTGPPGASSYLFARRRG